MLGLINRAKQGDKTSLEQAVKDNSGLVWSVARKFASRGYDPDDLYQIGCIGLIKAIRRFDTSYDVKFSTYAVPLIMGEIKRFLRDDGMIKVSRRYKEIAGAAAKATADLELKLMRKPTLGEIARETGFDVFELAEATEACAPWDSIYRTTGDEGGNETYLLDKLCLSEQSSLFDKTALSCAIDMLDNREKSLIVYRYFMDETQAKVASRLGVSQVQVSRIEKKALCHLKDALK